MYILGVRVDNVSMDKTLQRVESWLSKPGQYYITTPNLEIIQAAQNDEELEKILNQSNLSLPDSSRLSWLYQLTSEKKLLNQFHEQSLRPLHQQSYFQSLRASS